MISGQVPCLIEAHMERNRTLEREAACSFDLLSERCWLVSDARRDDPRQTAFGAQRYQGFGFTMFR